MEHLTLLLNLALWPLCLGMIGLILLQGGAGDISSAFGGGGMLDSTLGVGASKKMAKVTGWLAACFFGVVIFLAIPPKGSFNAPGSASSAPAAVVAPVAPAPATPPVAPAPAVAPAPVAAPLAPEAPATPAR